MKNRIGMFIAGAAFGAVLLTASGSHAAPQTGFAYGAQPVIVTQHTSTFAAPYCIVSERHRRIVTHVNGGKTTRGPWSPWKVTDEGHPMHATNGTICAVQPH